jgi:hypothetical protein
VVVLDLEVVDGLGVTGESEGDDFDFLAAGSGAESVAGVEFAGGCVASAFDVEGVSGGGGDPAAGGGDG